jgi:hypothetical protein
LGDEGRQCRCRQNRQMIPHPGGANHAGRHKTEGPGAIWGLSSATRLGLRRDCSATGRRCTLGSGIGLPDPNPRPDVAVTPALCQSVPKQPATAERGGFAEFRVALGTSAIPPKTGRTSRQPALQGRAKSRLTRCKKDWVKARHKAPTAIGASSKVARATAPDIAATKTSYFS